jgi:beta propeller repeat protein
MAYAALPNYPEMQITTDLNAQFDSEIDGNYIVYTDTRSGNGDVYLYNLETGAEMPIASSEEDEFLNAISGNIVAYTLSRFDDDDILVYDISTGLTKQITDPENRQFALRRDPAVCGKYVVWQDNSSGSYDIYCYDLETGTLYLISHDGSYPAAGDQIHPAVHGNLIVWEDYRIPSDPEIYLYDLSWLGTNADGVEIPLDDRLDLQADVEAWQAFPEVYGKYVVCDEALSTDPNDRNIVVWDLDLGEAVWQTTNTARQERARIDGTRVIWEDSRSGSNIDIYTYDLTTGIEEAVTDIPAMQFLCDISGNRIVWTDLRNVSEENPANYDIYMAEPAAEIAVNPTELNFGDVELGQSSLLIATISNLGGSPLEITVERWESNHWFDFSYTPTTATINPGSQTDLVVTYGPSDVGVAVLTLRITSNDPDEPYTYVTCSGRGVQITIPPEEMFQDLLDFYDQNIADNDLQGIGPGNSAENRETAIRNMILAANDLYAQGQVYAAIEQLQALYMKIDGESPPTSPPDFITGDPATLAEFRQIVQDVLNAISS